MAVTMRDLVDKHCLLGVTKKCRKCGEILPADKEFFYRNGGRKPGLRAVCIACVCETQCEAKRRRKAA